MLHGLTHPEYFTLTTPAGESCQGGDQQWFADPWRRRAGCGPTAAAAVLTYLARTRPALAPMAPEDPGTQAGFLAYMNALWAYLTPGAQGLDKPESFVLGCRSFALSRGCQLEGRVLEIPSLDVRARPSAAVCRRFLAAALDRDEPVAFLNFSNGKVENLPAWHWVTLTGLTDPEKLLCSALDGGKAITLDFSLWLDTALQGGALVSLGGVDLDRDLIIRPAAEADLDGIEAVYQALFAYEEAHGSFSRWVPGVYPTRAFAGESLAAGTLYVLEEEGVILGSMTLDHAQAPEYAAVPWAVDAPPEQVAVIHTLCVSPRCSRRGLGRQMVSRAMDAARARGCTVLRLDTAEGNLPAAAMYAAMGFRRAGRIKVLHRGLIPEELICFEHRL